MNNVFNYPKNPFYHATLSEIVKAYNIYSLEEYKIIQITRNPYDRFISSYFHEQKLLNQTISLDNFISQVSYYKYLLPHNVDEFYKKFYPIKNYKDVYYSENSWGGLRFYFEQSWWNDLNVNIKTFKLEDIKNDTSNLCSFLGINHTQYPQLNKNNYNPIILTPNQKDKIFNLFKGDFKMFDYKK